MINRWCVACGSVNLLRRVISREINGGKDELSLLECIECGHAQVEHIGEGDINESVQIDIFNDINTLRREARTKWYKRSAIVARIIDRLVPRGGIAVEVGCGRGEFLQAMGRRWEITGIDISQVAVDMARRATRRNVLKVTYKKYDIPDNSHDLIASFAVIEHLESPRELIQWSSNKLKKGGMLVIMTGDRHSDIARAMNAEWPLYWCGGHNHFFTEKSLNMMIEKEGFEIVRTEWRFQYGERGTAGIIRRIKERILELTGQMKERKYDYYYVYARKL